MHSCPCTFLEFSPRLPSGTLPEMTPAILSAFFFGIFIDRRFWQDFLESCIPVHVFRWKFPQEFSMRLLQKFLKISIFKLVHGFFGNSSRDSLGNSFIDCNNIRAWISSYFFLTISEEIPSGVLSRNSFRNFFKNSLDNFFNKNLIFDIEFFLTNIFFKFMLNFSYRNSEI